MAILNYALNIFLLFLIRSPSVCSLYIPPHHANIRYQSLNAGHFVLHHQRFTTSRPSIRNQSSISLPRWSFHRNHCALHQGTNSHDENSSNPPSNLVVKGVTLKMAFDRTYSIADASELKSERFTCPQSLDLVHKLRRNSDCVLVGRGTVQRDDCTLTVRRVDLLLLLEGRSQQQPVRVVIDSQLKLLEKKQMENGECFYPTLLRDGHRTIIYHSCEKQGGNDYLDGITRNNVTLVKLPTRDQENGILSPSLIIKDLEKKGILHVMVEGGPATAIQFLKEKVVDRAILIRAPVDFIQPVPSGMSDVMLEEAGLVLLETRECGDDVVEYWVRKGESWPTDCVEDWPR